MLVGELADIMEEIEIENKDFKKNVFFSNFHDLHNHLGIYNFPLTDNLPPVEKFLIIYHSIMELLSALTLLYVPILRMAVICYNKKQ